MSSTGVTPPGAHAGDERAHPTNIIVCETCGSADRAPATPTGGQVLRELVALVARDAPTLRIHSTRCLMACDRRCTALVQPTGRYAYVLGDLAPTSDDARSLVDYARLVHASERGVVPYRQWPDGVRGKFVCRVPPAIALEPSSTTPSTGKP